MRTAMGYINSFTKSKTSMKAQVLILQNVNQIQAIKQKTPLQDVQYISDLITRS